MGKPLTLESTQALAARYRQAYFDGVEPVESEDGTGDAHLAWMLDRITHEKMPIDKASRWLGYIQAFLLIYHGMALEDLKTQVRSAGELQLG